MNIVLIGYRGTGKSSIARCLAERLGWPRCDADERIARRAGKPIAAIFAEDGEAAFRELESHVVGELAKLDQAVIALGGGAVMREENRRAVRERGKVVWLQADAQTIADRLSADANTATQRPQLTGLGGMDEIRELLALREPVYRELADCQIDTVGKTPSQVCDEILFRLGLSRTAG